MMRHHHSPQPFPLLPLCVAVCLTLMPVCAPHAAEDRSSSTAAPADEQRSFQERLRGLWGDAKSAGSKLGSQAGEMWDSTKESSAGLWNDARKQGSDWMDEARRRWRERGD